MATVAELAQRAADILAIEDDVMTWNGADYSCTASELTKSDTPEIGGFERSYDVSVYVRTELFTSTIPNADDAVTLNGNDLKVVSVNEPPDGIAIELQLKGATGA